MFTLGAEGFEDECHVVEVAWFGRLWWFGRRSALVVKRFFDWPGILQAADGATEDSGRVGGLGAIHS